MRRNSAHEVALRLIGDHFSRSRLSIGPVKEAVQGALFVVVLLLATVPVGAQEVASTTRPVQQAEVERLADQIRCSCGCGLTVATCDHASCVEFRADIRAMIGAGLAAGDADQTILNAIAEKHGKQALAVPPNKGFDRVAWLFPSALVLGAALLGGFLLRRWSRAPVDTAPGSDATDAPPESEPLSDETRAAIAKELERYR